METFFKVKRPCEVAEILDQFAPAQEETVPLTGALGRVLGQDIVSHEDLPGFLRSAMDGYALKAKDSFGASETLPSLFEVSGEVYMGRPPNMTVGQGQAVKISTGGMLPDGADSVAMVEYCHLLDERTLEVSKAISPLENVIQPGDDVREGAIVLKKGSILRPQDLGVMAGLGKVTVPVYRKPVVAIISTGDEIVSVEDAPRPGEVRDINRFTLGALCLRAGAVPVYLGQCPDSFEPLVHLVENAMERSDAVWLSGGSSVGTRDLTLKVFETLPDFELLVHGISISPGKPTIIGRSGTKPLIGLPGHVASALVVAEIFMVRLIMRLSGYSGSLEGFHQQVEARLSRNIESSGGREDYVRVKLKRDGGDLVAEPVFGKSGLISTLVASDGLIRIDINTEGLYQGQQVGVMLFEPLHGGLSR